MKPALPMKFRQKESNSPNSADVIVIGAGASGIMAAIAASDRGAGVLLLEKQRTPANKIAASGGGRCNLTNTLALPDFLKRFGRQSKFMIPALKALDSSALRAFFAGIGIETVALDGFRVFPAGHQALPLVDALQRKLVSRNVAVFTETSVTGLKLEKGKIAGVECDSRGFAASRVILACGGPGYPSLGGCSDGFALAKSAGHRIVAPFPAMLPLVCREEWVRYCRADTIGKAHLTVNLPGCEKLKAQGDLIFSETGIRGPVVLDFAREITPLLQQYGSVPLLLNFMQGKNEEQARSSLMVILKKNPGITAGSLLRQFLPEPLAQQICLLAGADSNESFKKNPGPVRDKLVKLMVKTPLTITGHGGFAQAMVTRGGISLKEIDPCTLESRKVKGLFCCGEVLDLDGPCGGFNLQWAFSSGYLAGKSAAAELP